MLLLVNSFISLISRYALLAWTGLWNGRANFFNATCLPVSISVAELHQIDNNITQYITQLKYGATECCMTLPPLIVGDMIYIQVIIMGGVFHETFVSFITFEVYMFKDFNLLCWKEELLRQRVM